MRFDMRKLLAALLLTLSLTCPGQDLDSLEAGQKYEITDADYNNKDVEMADLMRSNGKIYVVVGVITILFAGIIVYLVSTDRKLSKMEKEVFKEKVNS